jgi:aminoglycoside phosphotransferase family enzyme/predicted kinase
MGVSKYESIITALQSPDAYPENVDAVELVETHISNLFLTGAHVYKVKKPVDFGFLDFTNLEKRRYYCHREVELNRRMSPEVYLGVVEIREQAGRFAIEGPGRPVEYAVKMLQLPRERSLNRLLRQEKVSRKDIRRLAARIANFHDRAETSPEISRLGSLEVVRENILENFAQTEKYVGDCLSSDAFDDLAAYSNAFLTVKETVFRRRSQEGRVRDCHGDLHTAQIFFPPYAESDGSDGISIIDCIEFNDRFRCSDVAEDVAFLAMDLDFHHHPDLSQLFIETYQQCSGDGGITELLAFFKAYRAYVRGKVTSFRLDDPRQSNSERQQSLEMARSYFQLAHSYTQIFPRASVFLVCGLSGTGKSTVAEELARRWDLAHISSDVTRKELAGLVPGEHRYLPPGQGIYSPEFTRRTYQSMFQQAGEYLETGRSVVLDATFLRRKDRARAIELAHLYGSEAWIVECSLAAEETRRRLGKRLKTGDSVSDASWEVYLKQREEWEPVVETPARRHIHLNTEAALQETIRELLGRLYASVLRE